jgi:16S rRNA (guanine966-N2)-methyltransferase
MSILAPELAGARVLDLFAGSGALGLEALSRGAASVEMVELAPASLAAIRENVRALAVEERVTVRRADALRHVGGLAPGSFDVAFADPPYATDQAMQLAMAFRNAPFARILSIEHPPGQSVPGDETRRYGDTALTFLRAP